MRGEALPRQEEWSSIAVAERGAAREVVNQETTAGVETAAGVPYVCREVRLKPSPLRRGRGSGGA